MYGKLSLQAMHGPAPGFPLAHAKYYPAHSLPAVGIGTFLATLPSSASILRAGHAPTVNHDGQGRLLAGAALIAGETEKWGKVVKFAGVKVE